jgi:hypothetical protein
MHLIPIGMASQSGNPRLVDSDGNAIEFNAVADEVVSFDNSCEGNELNENDKDNDVDDDVELSVLINGGVLTLLISLKLLALPASL